MNLFNRFLNVTLLSMLSFTGTILAEVDPKRIKVNSSKDTILWLGYGCPNEFDSTLIKNEIEKENAFKIGLKQCEDNAKKGDPLDQEILAEYYCLEEKVFKKGLFWSLKCAEQGVGFGMRMLSSSYFLGEGVIENSEEAMKWLFLGVAVGDEWSIKTLDIYKKEKDFDSLKVVISGKKMAKEWAKDHPQAFFNPD